MLTGVQITSLLASRFICLSRQKMNTGPRPQLSNVPSFRSYFCGS